MDDIFTNLQVPDEFINVIRYVNIDIVNTQQVMINKIITYIKGNNYFGEEYHNYKDEQIKANKWWIENFFVNEKRNYEEFLNERINFNESEMKLFNKNIR